jgi:hypothetical protein
MPWRWPKASFQTLSAVSSMDGENLIPNRDNVDGDSSHGSDGHCDRCFQFPSTFVFFLFILALVHWQGTKTSLAFQTSSSQDKNNVTSSTKALTVSFFIKYPYSLENMQQANKQRHDVQNKKMHGQGTSLSDWLNLTDCTRHLRAVDNWNICYRVVHSL